ncbi:MAG: hypothetical protein EBY39_06495 [Flavobacteriia bacterium]|nr:hypothetical protein [Flavobacteriia bacterium]
MTTETKSKVYVVTRNSRRIEEKNYSSKEEADTRAQKLVDTLKKWKDPDLKKVKVVHTDKPQKIR